MWSVIFSAQTSAEKYSCDSIMSKIETVCLTIIPPRASLASVPRRFAAFLKLCSRSPVAYSTALVSSVLRTSSSCLSRMTLNCLWSMGLPFVVGRNERRKPLFKGLSPLDLRGPVVSRSLGGLEVDLDTGVLAAVQLVAGDLGQGDDAHTGEGVGDDLLGVRPGQLRELARADGDGGVGGVLGSNGSGHGYSFRVGEDLIKDPVFYAN